MFSPHRRIFFLLKRNKYIFQLLVYVMLFWSNKYPSSCQYFRQQSCVMGRNIWLARSKAIWNYSLNKLNFVNNWAFNEKELIFKHISELFTTTYFFIVVITWKNINKKSQITNYNEYASLNRVSRLESKRVHATLL